MDDGPDDTTAQRLADGSSPATPDGLQQRLTALGISVTTVEHAPVFTVDEAKHLRGVLPGAHVKNLFLRNKKGAMWLVTCLEDRQIDLKVLGQALDAGRFSFGSADRLMTYLGVLPGAVTPFAVMNDHGSAVQMVLDATLFDDEAGPVNAHPLANHLTTAIAPRDLLKFLDAQGHPALRFDFESLNSS